MANARVVGAAFIAVLATVGLGCGVRQNADSGTTSERACPPRSTRPVDVTQLVAVFRESGISLDASDPCRAPTSADATNMGPSGLDRSPDVLKREGDVLCSLYETGDDSAIETKRYEGDEETKVSALNVVCSVYPSDEAHAAEQIGNVEDAMERLVATVSQRS